MSRVVLGPFLRGGDPGELTLWLELDQAGTVEVLDRRARTFAVAGHHYALVDLAGLPPGSDLPYDVRVDGTPVWPPPDWGDPPRIRTWDGRSPYRIIAGSCRQSAPHGEPWDAHEDDHDRGLGPDALLRVADEYRAGRRPWPDLLILSGDQVYADEPHPSTAAAVESRRDGPRPADRPAVTTFEEYTWLYHATWDEPQLQRLMASVPSVTIFDDHDIIDDWNTSEAWRQEISRQPWWDSRLRSGLMAYWIYQHLGNRPMAELREDPTFRAVVEAEDGMAALWDFAVRAETRTAGGSRARWSYRADAGPCRLVVVDTRNGRVLEEDARSMLDGDNWAWLDQQLTGDVDHLILVSSVPWLLPPAIDRLEAWDEALTRGAWGRLGARFGEWLRQFVDLEHWAAFGESFHRLAEVLGQVSRGERGQPPRTVTVVSGDLHFGYLSEVDLGGERPVRQVVTSPLRQASEAIERKVQRWVMTRPATRVLTGLLRLAPPRQPPPWSWQVDHGPWFDNNVATFTFDHDRAHLVIERVDHTDAGETGLVPLVERSLT